MPNPFDALKTISNLAKAAGVAAKIEKMDTVNAEGAPGKDGHPDYIQLMDACKKFISDLDTLNKDAVRIVKLESVLVADVKTELSK